MLLCAGKESKEGMSAGVTSGSQSAKFQHTIQGNIGVSCKEQGKRENREFPCRNYTM